MRVLVCSDTHFSHKNIIEYCNRPYSSVTEMDEHLIFLWNKYIDPEDIVIFCGDLCFCRTAERIEKTTELTRRLNGHKIIVKGNHDFKQMRYTACGWDAEFYQLFDFNNRLLFCHRPDNLSEWHKDYDFVFYGHTHQNYPEVTFINCINVCLDANDLRPLDITDYFTAKEIDQLKELINYPKGE